MFRFGFNSGFIASGVLRFTRQEIDDACKDKKYVIVDFLLFLSTPLIAWLWRLLLVIEGGKENAHGERCSHLLFPFPFFVNIFERGRFGKDFFMDLTFEDEEDHDINMYNHISRISELTVGALLSRRVCFAFSSLSHTHFLSLITRTLHVSFQDLSFIFRLISSCSLMILQEFLRSQGIRSRNVVQVEDEEVSSDSVLSRPRPRSTVNVFSTSGWNSDDARTIPGGSLSRLSVDSALR